MTELRALTSARGLAAWFVVLYHIRASIAGLPPFWLDIFAKGYLAVDFFFMLSGFVIWLSYGERIRTGGWGEVPAFLRKRIARIWPLHLVMLAFAVMLALLLRATGRPPDPRFPFAELPAQILLVQNWFGYGSLNWNDPAWSISAELFAYLLFPLIAMTVDWRKLPSVALLGVIMALIASLAAVMIARGLHSLGDFIPQFGLIRCVTEFTCGTVVGALWLRWRSAPRMPAILAATMAAIAFIAFASGTVTELLAIPVAFAGILLALALHANAPANPLGHGPVHYLGEISFATYLGHSLLWKAFKLVCVSNADAVPPGLVALYLVLVLTSSIALYHLIERPAQRWINALRFTRSLALAGER